jgi:hypothetical protein
MGRDPGSHLQAALRAALAAGAPGSWLLAAGSCCQLPVQVVQFIVHNSLLITKPTTTASTSLPRCSSARAARATRARSVCYVHIALIACMLWPLVLLQVARLASCKGPGTPVVVNGPVGRPFPRSAERVPFPLVAVVLQNSRVPSSMSTRVVEARNPSEAIILRIDKPVRSTIQATLYPGSWQIRPVERM